MQDLPRRTCGTAGQALHHPPEHKEAKDIITQRRREEYPARDDTSGRTQMERVEGFCSLEETITCNL